MRQLMTIVTLLGLILLSGCGYFDAEEPKSTDVSFQLIRNEVSSLESVIEKLEAADITNTETINNLHAAIAKLGGEIRKDQQKSVKEVPDVQAKSETDPDGSVDDGAGT